MELQTRLTVPEVPDPISYKGETLLLGSCFAGHIAGKLSYFKFRNALNPFGTLFHPRAISNLVTRALESRGFKEEDCFYHEERWHSHEVHSDLSRNTKEELLEVLNGELSRTKALLNGVTHLILTLGTSWGYRKKENESWVANCHKVPRTKFDKVLCSPSEITSDLGKALSKVYEANPEVSVILTISPVRHIRDGFVENQRSKAHLFVALHDLLERFADRNISYFPSYELLMDELRDYRFYEADMIHPNGIAIDYIWEKFSSTSIDKGDRAVMALVDEIQKGLRHRPFNPDSQAYKAFRVDLSRKIKTLRKTYPFMSFD